MPVARNTDPNTSWEAAHSIVDLRERHIKVLGQFTEHGPMTYRDLAERLPQYGPSGTRTRGNELYDAGLLRHMGRFHRYEDNRRHIVWGTREQLHDELVALAMAGEVDELAERVRVIDEYAAARQDVR